MYVENNVRVFYISNKNKKPNIDDNNNAKENFYESLP